MLLLDLDDPSGQPGWICVDDWDGERPCPGFELSSLCQEGAGGDDGDGDGGASTFTLANSAIVTLIILCCHMLYVN